MATFTDPEVARGINMFVSQDKATALSASLGECDYIAFLDGAMLTTDESLAEGALQGQSMFASTGDNGYACPEGASTGVPEGPPGVSWPSDGEYTTAVGGTTVLADSSGNVSNEARLDRRRRRDLAVGDGGAVDAAGQRCRPDLGVHQPGRPLGARRGRDRRLDDPRADLHLEHQGPHP